MGKFPSDTFFQHVENCNVLLQDIEKSSEVHVCEMCHKVFRRRWELTIHMKAVHQQLLYCSQCPNTFKTDFNLQRHEKNHEKGRKESVNKTIKDIINSLINFS